MEVGTITDNKAPDSKGNDNRPDAFLTFIDTIAGDILLIDTIVEAHRKPSPS
jgi:hypothetical protein